MGRAEFESRRRKERATMNRWRGQRGDVPVGCLVGLVVLAIVALIGIKAVPIMLNVQEFEKEVRAVADRGNRIDYTDKRMIARLTAAAEELDIPITAEDIRIDRTKSRIRIRVDFVKEIDFPGYTYVWHKEIDEDRPIF
jgi:hypothetical protein